MQPISERAKRALEDHRATTGFGPGRKDAVLERVERSIVEGAAESFVAELDHSGASGPVAGKRARRWGAAVALALAAGLAGFWWVSADVAGEQASEGAQQAAYAEQSPAGEESDATVRRPGHEASAGTQPVSKAAVPALDPEPPPDALREAPVPATSKQHRRKRTASEPTERAPDLAAELGLLRTARAAFAAGQPKAALAQLDEHAESFPRGQLVQERAALRVEVLCRLEPARGLKSRASFLKRYPNSSHAKRVRGLTCGSSE